jgi:hypothetical protein
MHKGKQAKSLRRGLWLLTLLAATLAPALSAAQPVAAEDLGMKTYLPVVMDTQPNIFGVAIQTIDDSDGLAQIQAAHADWVRRDFPWKLVESYEGERNWAAVSYLDQEFTTAYTRGVHVVGILGNTPEWARGGGTDCEGLVKPEKLSALASFASDLVRRYSNPPYNVKYWELWNEPDVDGSFGCWGDVDADYYGGQYYGQMLQVVYPAMKAADPGVNVMVGGLLLGCDPVHPPAGSSCVESTFLKGILASGAGNSFDGISFHAYDYSSRTSDRNQIGQYSNSNWNSAWNTTGPVTLRKAAFLRNLLSQFGVNQKFLMNTELAVLCGPLGEDACLNDGVTVITQAYYVAQSYAASLADGYRASIWYSVLGGRSNGLLTSELEPLPAYYAYQFTATELGRASFRGKPSLPTGLMGYQFSKGSKTIWVIWASSSQEKTLTLPSTPTTVYRVGEDGHPVPISATSILTVGVAPVFIEFGN